MYQIGDWIFYGNIGACQVTDVAEKKLPEMDKTHIYYTLKPINDDCRISTPADTGKIFMRPVISRKEAEELIDNIPFVKAEAFHSPIMRQLSNHYEEALSSHDCEDLIKMTMSIYEKRQQAIEQKRKLGAVDEKFMKRAEDLLFGEFAVALSIPRHKVSEYIKKRIDKVT